MTISRKQFDDLAQAYLRHLEVHAKRSTYQLAKVHVDGLRDIWGFGIVGEKLSAHTIDEWVMGSRLNGNVAATINSYLRTLRAILLRGGVDEPRVLMLRETRPVVSILTDTEADRLLAAAADQRSEADVHRDTLMLLLGLDAGLRHQEIVHATWRDFDGDSKMDRGEIRVTAKAGWTPKSYQDRVIPTTRRLWSCAMDTMRLVGGENGDWVFPLDARLGCLYPVTSMYDRVIPLFTRAGLYDADRRPGLHMLRRTWASNLLSSSADLETVRQLGGWSSIEVVQRYLGTTTQRKRDAIAMLEERR